MKSELAKARDKWLCSLVGEACCEGTPTGPYLQNRLERAFLAGANFSSKRTKELENKEAKELIGECVRIASQNRWDTKKDSPENKVWKRLKEAFRKL